MSLKRRLRNKVYRPKAYINHKLAYTSWCAMRQRCNNKNNCQYKDYGGRGITICNEWNSFKNFLEDMNDPPIIFGQRLSLERKDNNGNYNKDNCIWATHTEQMNNKNEYPKHRILI